MTNSRLERSVQDEGVTPKPGVGTAMGGVGLAVGEAVGVGERTIGVGVGGGGAGIGMMKKTILSTTIRLSAQKAICRVLARDLRALRFTVYLPPFRLAETGFKLGYLPSQRGQENSQARRVSP